MLTDLQFRILKVVAEMNNLGKYPSLIDIRRAVGCTYSAVLENVRYLEDKHLITNKSFRWKKSIKITDRGLEVLGLMLRIEKLLEG